MTDTSTLTSQRVIYDSISIDSLYAKINALHTLNSMPAQTSFWIPLLAAISGGVLVIAGQSIDRHFKHKTEIESNLLEIYAFCRKLEALMKNNYRELALAKTHVAYWWHCYQIADDKSPWSFKCYDEHLRSQSYSREIEKRIGDTKAEFIGHVRKFQAIKPLKKDIENQLKSISDLTHAKAKYYEASMSHDKIRDELIEQDEYNLREVYYSYLSEITAINDYLQSLIKS